MAEHELKCDPAPFDAVWEGRKTHEIRLNDRNYMVGDTLILRKTSDDGAFYRRTGERPIYTGAQIAGVITHVQEVYGLLPNWVCLSIKLTDRRSTGRSGSAIRSILPDDYE